MVMVIAVVCVALLGILLFGLGLLVSLRRGSEKKVSGFDADPANALNKAMRAHGNTTEYAPFLAVLFLYVGSSDPAGWVGWVIMATTLCRYLIVVGLLAGATMDKPHPLRFVGALGTYAGGVALSIAAAMTVL
jgi:uncharacterized membrane protein YecN with MAPEG domain